MNKGRLPELVRYVVNNPESYIFSALTASVEGAVSFDAVGDSEVEQSAGVLRVPRDANVVINDGQHRRAAIERALSQKPTLGDESLAVVFFVYRGNERSQQMFADLNRHAIRPSRSLSLLYDHRDQSVEVARSVVVRSPTFCDLVDFERSTISPSSKRLFKFSAFYDATTALLVGHGERSTEGQIDLARCFWEGVASFVPEWDKVRRGARSARDIRLEYVHSHGVALEALGVAGNSLLNAAPESWHDRLAPIATINWRRSNAALWAGRALVAGNISKARRNVALTAIAIKAAMSLPLTDEEQALENEFQAENT